MPAFVVTLHLPDAIDEGFIARLPRHRAFINQLMAEHTLESYAVSADRTRGWVTLNGENEAAVRALIEQFPLFEYFSSIEIDELFIFDSAAARFPAISLN